MTSEEKIDNLIKNGFAGRCNDLSREELKTMRGLLEDGVRAVKLSHVVGISSFRVDSSAKPEIPPGGHTATSAAFKIGADYDVKLHILVNSNFDIVYMALRDASE